MFHSRLVAPLAFLISASFSACSPSPPDTSSIQKSPEGIETYHVGEIDSAVIYCWCFENGQSRCFTWAAIKPKDLCDTSNHLLSITGFTNLSNLRTFLNNAKIQKNKWGTRDARFVIKCFEKDSSFYLTYADYNDSTLWIDGERELKCNMPILAWIMSEMGLREINCPN